MKNKKYILLYWLGLLVAHPLLAFDTIITNECNSNGEGSIQIEHFCFDVPNADNGAFPFTWYDNADNILSSGIAMQDTDLELLNQAAGTYTLELHDLSGCTASHEFEIINQACPEIEIENPACGNLTADNIYQVCVGASVEVTGVPVEIEGANIVEIVWDWGVDAIAKNIDNMPIEHYEVFWGTPGDKSITMTIQYDNGSSLSKTVTEVNVGTSAVHCNSNIYVELCSNTNPCDMEDDTVLGLSCQSSLEATVVQMAYTQITAGNAPYTFGVGTMNGTIESEVSYPLPSSYTSISRSVPPFSGDGYAFVRDANGCSTFVGILNEPNCLSCSEGISLPNGQYTGLDYTFECGDYNNNNLVDITFFVSCGVPPYSVTIDPDMPLLQDEGFTANLIQLELPLAIPDIQPNQYFTIQVTDAEGNTTSANMLCELIVGTGSYQEPFPACANTNDFQAPIFSGTENQYDFCINESNICIDYSVSESEDGIHAVYAKGYRDKIDFYPAYTNNVQGQFCFSKEELNLGNNAIELVAIDRGNCHINHTTYTVNIQVNEADYIQSDTELEVLNALEDNNVYYKICDSEPIYLQATYTADYYAWYHNSSFVFFTTSNQSPFYEPGYYTVMSCTDGTSTNCESCIVQNVFIESIGNNPNDLPALGATLQSNIIDDCPAKTEVTVVPNGGSGQYGVDWSHCSSCGENIVLTDGGTKTYTVTDLCTGEVYSRCINMNECGKIQVCGQVLSCSTSSTNLTSSLRISPTVYDEATTIEIELDEAKEVNLQYTDITGTSTEQILDQQLLPAGTTLVPINTSGDNTGIKVFTLEEECNKKSQLGIKINE